MEIIATRINDAADLSKAIDLLNRRLSYIGGDTSNFISTSVIEKANKEKPEVFESREYARLATQLVDLEKEWKTLSKEFTEKGSKLKQAVTELLTK